MKTKINPSGRCCVSGVDWPEFPNFMGNNPDPLFTEQNESGDLNCSNDCNEKYVLPLRLCGHWKNEAFKDDLRDLNKRLDPQGSDENIQMIEQFFEDWGISIGEVTPPEIQQKIRERMKAIRGVE